MGKPLVLHLIGGDLWAGAEVATWHLLCAIADSARFRLHALLFNEGALSERLRSERIAVTVLPESVHGPFSLARLVRAQAAGADLLHAHGDKESLVAALSGRPWVATRHGRPEPHPRSHLLRARLRALLTRRLLGRSARHVIAVSTEVAAWLAGFVPRERISVSWNGIADPARGSAPAPWRARPLRVGCLGRLYPVKAFELAVEATARLPGVELEILGEGPERPRLEAAIRASAAQDRIRLLGHLDSPFERVASWRALLVTSHHEGNPIGVMESMALGTPVLFGGELRGVEEMVAARGGWPVASRDPGVWAEQIGHHVADRPENADASGAARARFLEAFARDAAVERISRIYETVLRGGSLLPFSPPAPAPHLQVDREVGPR